jgi:hypothetical protein
VEDDILQITKRNDGEVFYGIRSRVGRITEPAYVMVDAKGNGTFFAVDGSIRPIIKEAIKFNRIKDGDRIRVSYNLQIPGSWAVVETLPLQHKVKS